MNLIPDTPVKPSPGIIMKRIRSLLSALAILSSAADGAEPISFNRDIRPILSQNCFHCHGPDSNTRKGDLRLDEGKKAIADGIIQPGNPGKSELIARISTEDPDDMMPPLESKLPKLSKGQRETLAEWIRQGAKFEGHWSYIKPTRPTLPEVEGASHPVDRFIQAKLKGTPLKPSPKASPSTLVRRLSLDLTGLPPTSEDVENFSKDASPEAWEALVDKYLASPAYGEHWARQWLDLARYADSAGYADDQPRTIWGYRDWVIRALNDNMPFDQFSIEQLAGDLLPSPTESQLVATAFHRNTQTNNEGGTNDEEFRNAAIVDRVNTTMAVWMGTTFSCAQCHNHKYDPISQEDYFRFFAILNNTEDSDKRNEQPTIEIFSPEQKRKKEEDTKRLEALQKELAEHKSKVPDSFQPWLDSFSEPVEMVEAGFKEIRDGGKVSYHIELPTGEFNGIALDSDNPTTPEDVIFELVKPGAEPGKTARFVRVYNVTNKGFLHLAEVQIFSGSENIALKGKASQVSTAYDGPAKYAIDGNTDGDYAKKSVTHTDESKDPWLEVDLGSVKPISKVIVWNRTDGGTGARIKKFRFELYDEEHNSIWKKEIDKSPDPSHEETLSGDTLLSSYPIPHAGSRGWHQFERPISSKQDGFISLSSKSFSKHQINKIHYLSIKRNLEKEIPGEIFKTLSIKQDVISEKQKKILLEHHINTIPTTKELQKRLDDLSASIRDMKPYTSVPVLKELEGGKRRKTHIQIRGNFLATDKEVDAGLPRVFQNGSESPGRLELSEWLVSNGNPLTSRVLANRYWESLFGRGIVSTSEEFGSQGELPTHPELLDWLATEIVRMGWDRKKFLKLLVTSHTYQQDSSVSSTHLEHDPGNLLLARAPRLRLTAEMVRDSALAASGLLSRKMYGEPVKPYQPSMGMSAAFGPGLDWQTSKGEDKYRRGIYVHWRRSNPYPSMVAFDAPNRFVCNLRRNPTNTPLQALVTLNDPVYIEAAQGLARRLVAEGGKSDGSRIDLAWRLCLSREPSEGESRQVQHLLEEARKTYSNDPAAAKTMATDPIGPLPDGGDATELAALTVAANIILNLDEVLQKR